MTLRIERGGTGLYVFVPVSSLYAWDPAQVTAEIAVIPPAATPAPGDWHAATWSGTSGREARWLLPQASYPQDGDYLCKVRLTAGPEQVVITSGRVTLG